MFELFKTSEKLMFPQTMPVVKSIRNLLNSALLFTCVHFTSPSGVNAQESEDPVLPDVMQVYADMLETQCQYDFIGNLNSNITNTGLGTIDFEDYARPALLPNLGGGFRFISEDGDCYSTESLTEDTEVSFISNQACAPALADTYFQRGEAYFDLLLSNGMNPPLPGQNFIRGEFDARFWDHRSDQLETTLRPLARTWRYDLQVSLPTRELLLFAWASRTELESTDELHVAEYTAAIPFEDLDNFLQNQELVQSPIAITFDFPRFSQNDRVIAFRLISPSIAITINTHLDSHLFVRHPDRHEWILADIIARNTNMFDTLVYDHENNAAHIPKSDASFSEYKVIFNPETDQYEVSQLSCTSTLDGSNRAVAYTMPENLTDPFIIEEPNQEVDASIDEIDSFVDEPDFSVDAEIDIDPQQGGSENAGEMAGDNSMGGMQDAGEMAGDNSMGGMQDAGEMAGDNSMGGMQDAGEMAGDNSMGGMQDAGEMAGDNSMGGMQDAGEMAGDNSMGGVEDAGEMAGDNSTGGMQGAGEMAGDNSTGGMQDAGEMAGDNSTGGVEDAGEMAGDNSMAGMQDAGEMQDPSDSADMMSQHYNDQHAVVIDDSDNPKSDPSGSTLDKNTNDNGCNQSSNQSLPPAFVLLGLMGATVRRKFTWKK